MAEKIPLEGYFNCSGNPLRTNTPYSRVGEVNSVFLITADESGEVFANEVTGTGERKLKVDPQVRTNYVPAYAYKAEIIDLIGQRGREISRLAKLLEE